MQCHKGGGRKDCSVHQKWTVAGGREGKRHRAAASSDYLSDFHSRINRAQLLGKAKRSQNATLPAQSKCASSGWEGRRGDFSSVSGDDASEGSIEANCQHHCQQSQSDEETQSNQ